MVISKGFSILIALITLTLVPSEYQPYIMLPLIAYNLLNRAVWMRYSMKGTPLHTVVEYGKVSSSNLTDEQLTSTIKIGRITAEVIRLFMNVGSLMYFFYLISSMHLSYEYNLLFSVFAGIAMMPFIANNLTIIGTVNQKHLKLADFTISARIKNMKIGGKRKRFLPLGMTVIEVEHGEKTMLGYVNDKDYGKCKESDTVTLLINY